MRDSQLQTPQRDQASANGRLKSNPAPKKVSVKVTKKNLSSEFKAVLESSDSVQSISDENLFSGSDENMIAVVSPQDTPESKTIHLSDLISPLSTITDDENAVLDGSEKCEIPRVDSVNKITSIEAALVKECLKDARVLVLKSRDLWSSRAFLDALVTVIAEELPDGVYEEEWMDELLSSNISLVFLTVLLWFLVFCAVWFFRLGQDNLWTGPFPT